MDIGIQHESGIDMPISQYRDMYVNVVVLSMSEEAPQEQREVATHQVLTRKRKRDQPENPDLQMIDIS